jgi:hypothetical protein
MALTTNQLIVGMFNMASGGYNALVTDYIAANGDVAAADALLQFTGLNPQFAGANVYSDADFASALVARVMPGLSASLQTSITSIVTNFITANPALSRGAVVVALINAVDAIPASDPVLGTAGAAFDSRVALADASTSTSVDFTELQAEVGGSAIVPGSTFTLTTGVDNIIGDATDNTIDASVSVLAGQVLNTLGSADKVDGGAGIDTLFVQNTGGVAVTTAPVSIKNIEVLQLDLGNSLNAYTLNLQSGDSAVTTVKSGNNNAAASSVINVQSAVKNVEVSNTNQNFTLSVASSALSGTADALALDVNAVTAGTVSLTAATGTNGYETLDITSSGSVRNVLTTLTTDNSLATINVAGTQDLNLGTALNNAVTKVDANAFTGKLNVTAGASVINVIGGTADDTINLDGTYTAADTINGGDGVDTLRLSSAQAIVTVAQSNVTNVEALRIGDALNGALNTTFFSGVNTVVLDTTAAATVVTGAASTITFNAAATGANTVTINNDDTAHTLGVTINGTATNDVLNINLNNADLAAGLTTTGAETVNLVSSNGTSPTTAADGGVNTATTITLAPTAATETLTISGDVAFTLAGAVTADAIDASGLTAGLTMAAATVATGSVTLSGGSAADVLWGSANADVINGGAGNDNITGLAGADLINGGAGSDVIIYTVAGQGGNSTTVASATAMTAGDLLADFVSGTGGDQINVNALATTHTAASGLAGAWNFGSAGVYILTGTNLDFVAATTTAANVATAIGNVTSGAGNLGYIAILDTQSTASTADDQYNIFEVVSVNAHAGAALGTTDTISLVGTVNGATLATTDFVA